MNAATLYTITARPPNNSPINVTTCCEVIPKEFIIDSHHWLILHGRYYCIARKPKCHECVVADVCNWPDRFDFGALKPIAVKNID